MAVTYQQVTWPSTSLSDTPSILPHNPALGETSPSNRHSQSVVYKSIKLQQAPQLQYHETLAGAVESTPNQLLKPNGPYRTVAHLATQIPLCCLAVQRWPGQSLLCSRPSPVCAVVQDILQFQPLQPTESRQNTILPRLDNASAVVLEVLVFYSITKSYPNNLVNQIYCSGVTIF